MLAYTELQGNFVMPHLISVHSQYWYFYRPRSEGDNALGSVHPSVCLCEWAVWHQLLKRIMGNYFRLFLQVWCELCRLHRAILSWYLMLCNATAQRHDVTWHHGVTSWHPLTTFGQECWMLTKRACRGRARQHSGVFYFMKSHTILLIFLVRSRKLDLTQVFFRSSIWVTRSSQINVY